MTASPDARKWRLSARWHGFYHVCFTVPDLEAAMRELVDLVGVRFGEPVHGQLGPWPYSLVFTDQPPHIDLISSIEGSPWETGAARFHHLGWWTSCLADTIDSWASTGASMRFDGREHGRRFAYLDAPHSGVRLEAVDAAQRDGFLSRWVLPSPDGRQGHES